MNVLEKILGEMENESKLAHEEMRRCARGNPLQFDEVKGYARAMEYVVDTIRSHMDDAIDMNVLDKETIKSIIKRVSTFDCCNCPSEDCNGENDCDNYLEKEVLKIIQNGKDINISTKCLECTRRKWYQKGYEDGRKDNGWIPVEDRLPEEHDSMFAKFKGTDKWNNSMFEKKSDKVNVTYELEDGTKLTTTSYTLDGDWKIEKENKIVKKKVIAWQPLPEPYKPEESKPAIRSV